MKIEKINEGGLSRLWQHTRDASTFAIIGSQDKDTKEDRGKELADEVNKLLKNHNISCKRLKGSYTYDNGDYGEEDSAIIFGLTKEDALRIAKKLNQESIVWKDDSFFGFLTPEGEVAGKFTSDPYNMTFKDVEAFGSRLAKKKNHNDGKKFAFKLEMYYPSNSSSVRNLGGYEVLTETLLEINKKG